ncbi:hypothetical protein HBI49_044470 [Parastagonospora nodorum]|nr:hypothetical protein HBI49_044470 [Parastagonospora nodorum]KAH6529883.1 hypothetical protein HBI07_171180 [Parastagonospora nodorum]
MGVGMRLRRACRINEWLKLLELVSTLGSLCLLVFLPLSLPLLTLERNLCVLPHLPRIYPTRHWKRSIAI